MENKENNNFEDIDSNLVIDIKPKFRDDKTIPLVKKIFLFVTGFAGIYLIALLASAFLLFSNLDKTQQASVSTFITYGVLFAILFGILNFDLKHIFNEFKKWKSWLIGIGFGAALILVPIFYTTIISEFYEYHINENETSLRQIIAIYPVLSVLFFGVIGPICEELTYRVGLFGSLSKYKWLAYLVAIFVFALAHFSFTAEGIIDELINLPIYLFSGFMFAFAYDKFGLSASLAAHMTNNLYSVIVIICTKE